MNRHLYPNNEWRQKLNSDTDVLYGGDHARACQIRHTQPCIPSPIKSWRITCFRDTKFPLRACATLFSCDEDGSSKLGEKSNYYMATATELVSNHDTISRPTSQGCGVERRILFGRWLALQGLCRSFVELSAIGGDEITHSGQEPPLTYRRANPSKLFSGRSAEDLLLASPNWYEERKNRFSFGCSFFRIDRVLQKFVDSESSHHSYDNLVLATGSLAWMPPISHSVLAGVFLYRTDAARYRKIVLPQRHVVGAICGNQWDR